VHNLAAELIGRDPIAVRDHFATMQRMTFKAGPGGAVGSAVAALDCALWDLRAKWNGVPLWRELGASDGRVPAYASGLDMPLSDEELRAYYERMATRHGISAGKLKVGRHPRRDLERMAIMRDALATAAGDADPALMLDANEFWTPKQAIARIAAMEQDYDLLWVEEPVRRDDHRGLARVSRAVKSAIATGENLTAATQFVPLLREGSADVIQVAVQGTGISGALRIFDMADAFGLPVALVNSPGRYAAHVGAVLSNHLAMEVIDPPPDVVFDSDDRLEEGFIVLGEGHGLGITFDEERLARYAVDDPTGSALAGRYRRASDSGISWPGVPHRRLDPSEDATAPDRLSSDPSSRHPR
jgi:L-alanine-DL-glutamate epimerase-like enolase superfamily enzyme